MSRMGAITKYIKSCISRGVFLMVSRYRNDITLHDSESDVLKSAVKSPVKSAKRGLSPVIFSVTKSPFNSGPGIRPL
jgi:hypothetical protein